MVLSKIEDIKVLCAVLHDLCHTHPKMNEKQFEALTESLSLNGQQQPIITYRGKVIDGRHRIWALNNLGIDLAHAVELPRNTKMEEVESFVKASETRRHQTKTQLACHAYLSLINPKTNITSATQAALDFGVSKRDVSICKTIAENIGIATLESFSKGETINICVNGVYSNYSSIRRLYDAIKRKQKEFIIKKPVQNVPYNLNEERANVRNFCMNDSNDKVAAKLQLMQEYLNGRFE